MSGFYAPGERIESGPTITTADLAESTAFSNGTEFEVWAYNWCDKCAKDDGEIVLCPILDGVVIDNRRPAEWLDGTDDYRDRYHCGEFEEMLAPAFFNESRQDVDYELYCNVHDYVYEELED